MEREPSVLTIWSLSHMHPNHHHLCHAISVAFISSCSVTPRYQSSCLEQYEGIKGVNCNIHLLSTYVFHVFYSQWKTCHFCHGRTSNSWTKHKESPVLTEKSVIVLSPEAFQHSSYPWNLLRWYPVYYYSPTSSMYQVADLHGAVSSGFCMNFSLYSCPKRN